MVGGLSHYGLGNLEKAADYLKIHVRLNPGQPGPSKLLASIYIDRGDAKSAISLLEPLRTTAPNDPQVLTLFAAAQMAERRYSQAAALLEQAVKAFGRRSGRSCRVRCEPDRKRDRRTSGSISCSRPSPRIPGRPTPEWS